MTDYLTESDEFLQNKLGITDASELKKTELEITLARQMEIESDKTPAYFSFALLKALHLRLFGDLYEFAGQIRSVDITKGPIPFCYVQNIQAEQKRIFNKLLNEKNLVGLKHIAFAKRIAYYAAELNALHPFREGNGRTIRLFLRLLAKNAGYSIHYHECINDELLQADVSAFHGDLSSLEEIYQRITYPLTSTTR